MLFREEAYFVCTVLGSCFCNTI